MTDSGFSRQTLPQLITTIRSDILTRLAADSTLAELRRTDAEVYARVQAAAVHTVYGYIDYLARNMLPDQADEDWLERHGTLKRCPRKSATAAAGFVRWSGATAGITLAAGVTIQRDDGVTFTTTEAATVSDAGILRVPVTCDETGTTGNTDDGISMRLASPVTGLSSTAAADTITGGTATEDLEEWRARIMERWYYIPQSGADSDYVRWAKEVSGVSRAWTYRHYSGTGTVGVMLATNDPENPAPDQSIVDATREYILPLAPVAGAGLFVFAVTEQIIDLEIAIIKDTEATRASVIAEINDFFLRDGEPDSVMYKSRLSEAISNATGENAHALITPTDDITINPYSLPVLGEITWSSYPITTG